MDQIANESVASDLAAHDRDLRGIQVSDLVTLLVAGLVGFAAFFNTLDLNTPLNSASESVGLDGWVAIKLAVAGVCGLIGFVGAVTDPVVRRTLLSMPGVVLIALAAVFLLTSAFALPEAATVCRAAAMIYVAYLLFIPTAIWLLGVDRFLIAVLVGLVLNMIGNWILYLAIPSIGVFNEELSGQTIVGRMGGLGHPNAVGRIAVLAGLVATARMMTRSRDGQTSRVGLWIAICVLATMTIVAAWSRTAVLAGGAAAAFLLMDRLMTRAGVAAAMAGAGVVLFGAITLGLWMGDDIGGRLLSVVTKTGDMTELTSATGRTQIWAEAIRLIGESPLTGYGLNSSPLLLEDFSYHTHNLVLHATFSGGVLAGFLIIATLLWNAFVGLPSSIPVVRAISMFILVSSLFEDTVLDTFAGPSTLLWLAVMFLPSLIAWERLARQPGDRVETTDSDNGPIGFPAHD